LVYLLLGGQWNQVSEIFAILGLSAGLNIIYNTIGWLHVSLGRTDRWLKWGIIGSLAMVVGFLLGLPFGPRGVASAYTLVIILITFPGILYAGKPIGLRFHEVFSTIWRYTGASVLAGAVIVSIKSLFVPKVPIIWIMIFSLVAFFLTYLVFVAIIYWSVKPIADFVVLFKNIVYKMLSRNKSD
jgi:PST family polysaccharide transporter